MNTRANRINLKSGLTNYKVANYHRQFPQKIDLEKKNKMFSIWSEKEQIRVQIGLLIGKPIHHVPRTRVSWSSSNQVIAAGKKIVFFSLLSNAASPFRLSFSSLQKTQWAQLAYRLVQSEFWIVSRDPTKKK